MTKGPRYHKLYRRRSEGKTNYNKRLKLLKSRKLRAVVRVSNNHVRVQIVQSKMGGDEILVSAFSKELKSKYNWKASTGNIPAAYLTGYVAGLRAKSKNIENVILDLSQYYHKNRILAAFKGLLDTGIKIPYREEFFPENLNDRNKCTHIEQYAELLKSSQPEKYEQLFSGYLQKEKINPMKISQIFSQTLNFIENNA